MTEVVTPPAAPVAAPTTPPAPTGAPVAPPAAQWFDSFQNAELKGWVQAAGVQGAEQAASKAWNLEKMMGADRAGRTVVLPVDQSDPKAWEPVYEKLGRPATADAYKLDIPEGADAGFAKTAATWFHGAGLTQSQAQNVTKAWNDHIAQATSAQQAADAASLQAEHAALAKDWGTGPAADAQKEMGRRAAQKLGLDETAIGALEKVVGFSKVMKAFAKMGELMGEGRTEGLGDGGSFGMTPEAAIAQRARLMSDREFGKRYVAGDASAQEQMRRLDEIIATNRPAFG